MRAFLKHRTARMSVRSVAICSVLLIGLFVIARASLCDENQSGEKMMTGAPRDIPAGENDEKIHEFGKFAVEQYNNKEGKNLSFKKIVSAKTQVVAGTMYHLVIEAHDGETPKQFEAKVWHKPWESHKSLEHFQPHSDISERGGLRSVPVDDPVIKEAGDHALRNLNDRSNSLVPYKLREVLSAHAEATDEETNINLRIQVVRGAKEEEIKVDLHRTADGKWTVT